MALCVFRSLQIGGKTAKHCTGGRSGFGKLLTNFKMLMISLLNTRVLNFKILFICTFQLTLHKGKLKQNSCLRSRSRLQTNDRARKFIKLLTPFQVFLSAEPVYFLKQHVFKNLSGCCQVPDTSNICFIIPGAYSAEKQNVGSVSCINIHTEK